MTAWQASILVMATLVATFLVPIGYALATVTLLAVAAYGLYAAAIRLNARFDAGIPKRTIATFALGTFLFAVAGLLEFIRRVALSPLRPSSSGSL
ncbi:MAG: hypothetical protein F4X98_17135 [Gammaproteobacteria bacterium]|nr:hypothetical protein [Gammaproteobacteria bacterium]